MSKRDTYEAQTEQYLEEIVKDLDLSVYDVEYVKEGSEWYLRAYIDKPEGITIQDCEQVSRAMSAVLDEKDYISDAYIFEVSSPGLGRTLKKDKHFAASIGQEVEVKTYKPIDQQKEFVGVLERFDTEDIVITMAQGDEQVEQSFKRSDVAIVKLTFDY